MDELVKAKHVIGHELDSVVKVAAFNYSSQGTLSGDANQAICNVIEAVFIHGLKDAFFLKGSRYSKYPEPNFWPFVSKFTHRSIKNQIDALKQIKNEIGKARAWVRIVLNEGALEHYISLLAKDSKQLNLFYMKGAFLTDVEMLEAMMGYLKALSKIPLSAPTNSCFLNNWTPSPLILAGLIAGKPNRLPQKTPSKSRLASSLENDETEMGMSALDLLNESPMSNQSTPIKGLDRAKPLLPSEDDDERSSIYSHPSMLDGGVNVNFTTPFRPNYSPILASTPENYFLNDSVFMGPSEELSSEVIVQHRRTHIRKHSKSSSEEGNSRKTSRSRSQSTSQLPQYFNGAQLDATSISNEARSTDGNELLDPNLSLNAAGSTVSSAIVSETADSGIEPNNENEDQNTEVEANSSSPINEVVFSIVPHPPTHDIITEADKRRIPILSESLESDQQMYGTSLHDELLCVPALSSSGPSAPSTVGNSLASRAWTIPSSKDSSFDRDHGNSFSSSVGTEYSDVIMQSLDTALKNAMKNYDEDMELERNRNDSFNARFYELTEAEQTPSPQQESSQPPETSSTNILKKATEITEIPINQTEEVQEENEPIVIEQDTLDSTDEYGIPRNLLALLTKIPTEKGLDAQEFRCPSCRKSIGGSFSSFKLCNLDCRYYCEECWKRGDESLIPARLILNWDTRPRPISKASKAFLKSIADRPLIRIDKMNSRLYQHSKQMEKILKMREKLSLVAMYLLSCKQSVADDLKRRLWPNHYLYSDIHLYSVTDLQNVTTGVLERRLNMVITSAISHINSCALCLQKGFICEICSSKKVIYPFQMDIAFRCTKCFAVFHIKCIEKQECPKCLRRAKYSFRSNEEMDGSTLPLE